MRIEKITQYNQLNYNYMAMNPELKSQTSVKNSEVSQHQTPSFNGLLRKLKDLAYRKFIGNDEEQPKRTTRRAPFSDEQPWDHSKKHKTSDRPITRQPQREVIKTPSRKTVKEPLPEISPAIINNVAIIEVKTNKYALIDEYDRLSKARAELRNKTKGRALTQEEKDESERLRSAWSEVYHRLIPEHQSIVRTKNASEFANETEKQK